MLNAQTTIAYVAILTSSLGAADAPKPGAKANRLARESSPYLLQHAHNPVDWYPWCPEALAKAKQENKLIFLSIGYSACHWCHVMERETFSNDEVARILNESFVCIKVDREERPDIDQVYMTALQCCRVAGGWPLSMFLTPDAKPITGGTYWPPDDKQVQGQTMRGFKGVLKLIIDLNKNKPKELRERAEQIAELTRETLSRSTSELQVEPSRKLVDLAAEVLEATFDQIYGGFGNPDKSFRGPKFPTPPSLELLWQLGDRKPELRLMANKTLTAMARGGIYDQVGGGFHRYTVERTWTVPHFEKMLYDNAQLVELYAKAFAETKDPLYRRVVEETLEFVRRDMTSPDGAFYSALDADSDGEEGKSYVWTHANLGAALPNAKEFSLAKQVFGCEGAPNFEGTAFVLTRTGAQADEAAVASIRQKLLSARNRRPKPFLDTKILTGWNGEMIAGYAEAGRHLGEPKYVDAAARAADFVLIKLRHADGRLARMFAAAPNESPTPQGAAFLDDYTFLVHGLLALHDATNDRRWLNEAQTLTDITIRDFGDEKAGGFFFTTKDHEMLFVRTKDSFDGPQPSGNSAAVRNLLRLANKSGDARYREWAEKSLRSFAPSMEQNPSGLALMAAAMDTFLIAQPPPGKSLDPKPKGDPTNSDSVVKATATAEKPGADGKQIVKIKLAIDKGWHIYANPVGNEDHESAETVVRLVAPTTAKAKLEYPKGKLVKDKLVGDYSVYQSEAIVNAIVQWPKDAKPSPLEFSIKLQACNDKTCLLPSTIRVKVP